MDSLDSPKPSGSGSASATQRKLRRSSLALAGVNKNVLALSDSIDAPSPDSNASSSEKSGKSSGFSLFGLFTRKKADSEAELLKKDDSFSTFSTEECSSPSYSFSSSDNKVLEDVPKRRFSLGLDSRAAPAPILVNGSPIKISAKRQSMSLVNAPVDKKSSKSKAKVEDKVTSSSVEGAISFRNPVILFSGGRRSQTDPETGTDSEVLSNSLSNPDDDDAAEEEEEEPSPEKPQPEASNGKRRSSVTLTVPAALIEAKGTAKAKYYFMRRSISCKGNELEEGEEETEREEEPMVTPPADVPSSPSKAKFVLWQSVDEAEQQQEEEHSADGPSAVEDRPFETVVHNGRRLSVRAVSENAPPAPAPPSNAAVVEEEESVVPDVTVVQAPDGRRLSVRAVSANAPPAPAPPGVGLTVHEVADEDGTGARRRVSVRAVTLGAPAAPAPPSRASLRIASDEPEATDPVQVVQSPDGRRLSVRAVSTGAPPAPAPPKRDSVRVDNSSSSSSSGGASSVTSVVSPEGRRLSVRSLTDNAPPAPTPPKRDSLRGVSPVDQQPPPPFASGVASPPPPPPVSGKRLSVGGDEVVHSTPDGRRLSVRAVTANAPPAPAPPSVRGSLKVTEQVEEVSVVQSGDDRRLSVRAMTANAPPAPAPPSVRGSLRLADEGGNDVSVVQSGDGRRMSVRAVSSNAPPAPAPPSVRGSLRVTEVQSGDGRRLSVRAVSENAPPAPAPPSR